MDRVWSFGPRSCGPNILLCNIPGYKRASIWACLDRDNKAATHDTDIMREFDNCLVSGFQMATLSGPICEEQMHGVCFIVDEWQKQSQPDSVSNPISQHSDSSCQVQTYDVVSNVEKLKLDSADRFSFHSDSSDIRTSPQEYSANMMQSSQSPDALPSSPQSPDAVASSPLSPVAMTSSRDVYGPMSGQLMVTMKSCCRRAFQQQPQRLMWAVYKCGIQAGADILGKFDIHD